MVKRSMVSYEESEEMMRDAFAEVGQDYGFKEVLSEFVPFSDFKVRWSRYSRRIEFTVSDYLIGAPKQVFIDLAHTLFSKLANGGMIPYGDAMREWVLDDEFSMENRPVYIKRSRYLINTSHGDHKDLDDSIDRLNDMGLISKEFMDKVKLVWTRSDTGKASMSSLLMRVIAVCDDFDDEDVPDSVIDYIIYTQYLRLVEGVKTFGFSDDVYIRDDQMKFDRYEEAERFICKFGFDEI